ncbi:MAG: signal peptidase I [Planctomycetes bacterium]|nr:signal peptidase I [Planctomycetota bacterium]
MSETKPPPHHWRENIEALTMAIVVALLFKYFVLEISKIPSGSMQPTLMGDPKTETFDRTVVDKLSFHFRDPERFEIVVFKHPLEESRVMVKRLVGMPGEELHIEHGDLWTRSDANQPWRILRRPPSVVREMLRPLPPVANGRDWSVVRGGKEWQIHGDTIVARGEGAARFRADSGPLKDEYYDGYPTALMSVFMERYAGRGTFAVGDLRLEGELVALADTRAVHFELTEGSFLYEFTLPGPQAAEAELSVRIRDARTGSEQVVHGERCALVAGARVAFALENIDDRLSFELEGRTVLTSEIATSERQEASFTLSVDGPGADFSDLRVARDVYYQGPGGHPSWSTTIPAGHYVMLGDNTQDSADSRLWEAQTFTVQAGSEAVKLRGNLRQGENPIPTRLADGGGAWRFKDNWGEVHWIPDTAVRGQSLVGQPSPLVPRELILGRAVAIFWPIWPFKPQLWRVGWLR